MQLSTSRISQAYASLPGLAKQFLFVMAFCGIYLGVRQVSFQHWYPPVGVLLLAVLITPYRYWAALALGSSLVMIPNIVDCGKDLSWTWKVLMLFPRALFLMPLVAWGQSKKWLPCPAKEDFFIRITPLIAVAFTVSLVIPLWAIFIGSFASTSSSTPGAPNTYILWLNCWILGVYIGILTIVPTGLLVMRWLTSGSLFLWNERITIECIINLIFMASLYVIIKLNHQAELGFLLRLGLLLPIVWAAISHGWAGAALAGTASNIVLARLAPHAYDLSTMQTEVVIAFVLSVFLALGSHISLLDRLKLNICERDEEKTRFLATGRQLQQQTEARFHYISQWLTESLHDFKGDIMRCQRAFKQIVEDLQPLDQIKSWSELHGFLSQLYATYRSYGIVFKVASSKPPAGFAPPPFTGRLILEASAFLACRIDRFDRIRLELMPAEQGIQIHLEASYGSPEHQTSLDVAVFGSLLRHMQCVSNTGLKLDALEHLVHLHHGHMEHAYNGQSESLRFILEEGPPL